MDQTKCFQQIVHTIGNHSNSIVCNGLRNEDKSRQISWKLRELVASITCMKDYLLANQKDYVNIYNSILYLSSKMTDEERDQIDKDVHDFVKLGNDVIKILRVELKSTTSKQQFEHEMNAINLVEMYLQSINDLHNKNKALRLRRNLYMQKFFRLNKSNVNSNNNNTDGIDGSSTENQAANKTTIKLRKNQKSSETNNNTLKSSENLNSKTSFYNDYHNEQLLSSNNESMNNCRLAPEEQKQFQLESKQIYDQMNSMNEEVITITKKLAEISKLQELFSENVIKQECDLNNLNLSTITSNESIREGNEQLREAMRKNAGSHVDMHDLLLLLLNRCMYNKVIYNAGLFIIVTSIKGYEILSAIMNKSDLFVNCRFQCMVFNLIEGETMIGKIQECTPQGVTLSLNFYKSLAIDANYLPNPSKFEHNGRRWVWIKKIGIDEHYFSINSKEDARFKILKTRFNRFNLLNQQRVIEPMITMATFKQDLLGPIDWWN
ncbi:syntaxin 18 [Dermatophagoides pteronyssinus]|uniref:syntaxin 18 n=1 Tax=Dermatophagoides pteronyssinus TaxID=6956 RepID=UPI003F674364